VLALSAAPNGFTASDLAEKVCHLTAVKSFPYTPRQAAYDLKKLRGKGFVEKIDSSHRYRLFTQGIRALTALVALRDKILKPLLASCCQRKRGPKPKNPTVLDTHYERLQIDMQQLFKDLGFAAA
jgi:hypothetical protein